MNTTKDLSERKAVEKVREMVTEIGTCMFCTKLNNPPFSTRPMVTQQIDDEGILWFFSDKNSNKNAEIDLNSPVELLYTNEDKSEFLSVYGHAEIIRDSEKAKELWNPATQVWFELGPEDPDLTIIKITPEKGQYWDKKHNKMVTLTEISMAAVMGSKLEKLEELEVEVMLMS